MEDGAEGGPGPLPGLVRSGSCLLHVDHRLAVLRPSSDGSGWQVLRSVHGKRLVQLSTAGRILLGNPGRHVRPLWRHLPRGSEAKLQGQDEAEEDGVPRLYRW